MACVATCKLEWAVTNKLTIGRDAEKRLDISDKSEIPSIVGMSKSVITTPMSGVSAMIFRASGAVAAQATVYPRLEIVSRYSSRHSGSSSTRSGSFPFG